MTHEIEWKTMAGEKVPDAAHDQLAAVRSRMHSEFIGREPDGAHDTVVERAFGVEACHSAGVGEAQVGDVAARVISAVAAEQGGWFDLVRGFLQRLAAHRVDQGFASFPVWGCQVCPEGDKSDMQFFPFSGLQIAQLPVAHGGADQSQCREADLRRHTAHLAVLAFVDREFDPGRGDAGAIADRRVARPQAGGLVEQACVCRAGDEVTEIDPAAQQFQRSIVGCPLDLRPVGFGELVFWIGDTTLERTVIG